MMQTRMVGMALLVAGLLAAGIRASDDALVAHWALDEDRGRIALDSASGTEDAIGGFVERLPGVSGRALRFDDMTTHVRREAARAPSLDEAFTVEAWVALQAYPWNWTALVEQGGREIPDRPGERESRVFLGVDGHGRVGWKVAVEGAWRECVSTAPLPHLEWTHVAGTFHRDRGLSVFVGGERVCDLAEGGTVTPATGGDVLLGRSHRRLGPIGSEREPSAQTLSPMVLYGALDEVKIHARALTPEEVAAHAAVAVEGPRLEWLRMPSGPTDLAPAFVASYGRLRYTDAWEAGWRVDDVPDILIRFDRSPVRLVFWRGTSYGAAWVTENGRWMGDQSLERSGGTPRGTAEHMNDKQMRYSRVRLIEEHDARKVVHWRYALTDIDYGISRLGVDGGPGEWGDEYYTVYPDGVATRRQVLWTDDLRHEWQETIVLHSPGTRPEDNIELEAMTLANLRGETRTYSWAEGAPGAFDEPEDANIQLTHLKSRYKPFIVFEPRPRIKPFRSAIRPEVSHFPWWNHWPVAQLPNDGRRAMGPGRPGHSSLSQSIEDSEVIHRREDGAFTAVTLVGLTPQPIRELVTLARSWLSPPPLTLGRPGYTSEGYDREERAYVVRRDAGPPVPLEMTIGASPASPLVHLAFVVRGWGEAGARLEMDGVKVPPGEGFRTGRRHTLESTDLIVWIDKTSTSPVQIRLVPEADLTHNDI
jgi:hypothetical protein